LHKVKLHSTFYNNFSQQPDLLQDKFDLLVVKCATLLFFERMNKKYEFHKFEMWDEEIDAEKIITVKNTTYMHLQ